MNNTQLTIFAIITAISVYSAIRSTLNYLAINKVMEQTDHNIYTLASGLSHIADELDMRVEVIGVDPKGKTREIK